MENHKYQWFADAAHGWLRVPLADVNELGCGSRISRFSYANGRYAYLEEDCDAGVFIEAYRERFNRLPNMLDERVPTPNRSRIRDYADYIA